MSVDAKMIHDKCMSVIRRYGAGDIRASEVTYSIAPVVQLLDGHGEMIDKEAVLVALREEAQWFLDGGQLEAARHFLDLRDKVEEM